MKYSPAFLLLPLLLLLHGCSSGDASTTTELTAAEQRASRAADKLMAALVGELTAAMKEGGPVHAVRYCADNAQAVTRRVAEEQNCTITRITDKPRNRASAVDGEDARQLERLRIMLAEGRLAAGKGVAETRVIDGVRHLQYLRPLVIKPACLTCHGSADDVPADVASVIAERYPDDRAHGYAMGEMRGAIRVLLPLD